MKAGADAFPEEDLKQELLDGGHPIASELGDLLALFGIGPTDRPAIAEISEWFEELGIVAVPELEQTSDPGELLTLYLREWGAPGNGAAPERVEAVAVDTAQPAPVEREELPAVDAAEPDLGEAELAAQLASETGIPLRAARDVVETLDPEGDFAEGLRARALAALELFRAEPAPAKRRLALPRLRRRRSWARVLSYGLFVVGGLLLLEAGITVLWQEPFSAFTAARAQARLEDKLERLEQAERGREAAEKRRLLAAERREDRGKRRKLSKQGKAERRMKKLANAFNTRIGEAQPLGEISIPKFDVKQVMVQGTGGKTLRQGPGHYRGTTLPGQGRTVGIAGHRTTYSAPFKRLNELEPGDEVFVKLPYGLFTYRIEGRKIIPPSNIGAFRRAGYERLMMTACHPLFSSKKRIIAWGRLVKAVPRGAAVL